MNMVSDHPPARVFNRKQRKMIVAGFRDIFRETQRNLKTIEEDAKTHEDAQVMLAGFLRIKAIANPTFEEKLEFLKAVAPEWKGFS
jgi:hypothetical protein